MHESSQKMLLHEKNQIIRLRKIHLTLTHFFNEAIACHCISLTGCFVYDLPEEGNGYYEWSHKAPLSVVDMPS
jgi:hypothetical protein